MAVTRANPEDLDTNCSPTQRATQQATQSQQDNSGLEEVDIADVICILHPCSVAAYQVVVSTAMRSPQHVLQNVTPSTYSDGLSIADLEKEETFLAADEDSRHPLDLALRLSAHTVNPAMGFVFGRNPAVCDVVIDTDTVKRVSNIHFRIYMTEAGVCMLHDMSTNGTLVDEKLLRGRGSNRPATMMLTAGSVIQILSTKRDESLKFIFRIPSRESHFNEYAERFTSYMNRVNIEQAKQDQEQMRQGKPNPARTQSARPASANLLPIQQNPYGMYWNGGDKYNVTGHLGKGAFATVYRLNSKVDGQLFAVKELEKRRFMKNGIMDKKLDNELQIMRDINHPHVVQYMDYHDIKNHLYIIMELVPFGDLQQWLGANGPLPEDLAKPMAYQVFDALAYLHAKMITHRDIKPDNILIADGSPQSFTVKLSDFGLSKVVSDNETFLKTFCGTLLYCAPEVFPHYDAHMSAKGRKRNRKGTTAQGRRYHCYSQSVDIWSFGGVLWYALCCRPPFEGVADHTGRAMFERIISTPLDTTILRRKGISEQVMDLLILMLDTDPSTRPSALQCLTHEWLGAILPVDPNDDQQSGLNTIEEEDAEGGAAPDLSQLSIHGRFAQQKVASHDSSHLEFLDPRQSKRFKSGVLDSQRPAHAHQLAHPLRPTNAGDDPGIHDLATNDQPKRLFGEVQQSLLQSSGIFGAHTQKPAFAPEAPKSDVSFDAGNGDLFTSAASHQPDTDMNTDSKEEDLPTSGPRGQNSASLEGAESDLRDLNMDSSQSAFSFTGDPNEPQTPRTPEDPPQASAGQVSGSLEETPRPAGKPPSFHRQISLPLSASSFYDPNDPSTHSVEYASSISGYDFTNHNLLPGASFHSLPPTTANSDIDSAYEQALPMVPQSQPEFIRPAPRLGRLTTTSDSFTYITLDLSSRITTWGRSPLNTSIFPDPLDTRVPKRGIVLFFHAKGIDKIEKRSEDWTKLPGLHCLIATDSSNGIFINGIKLNAKDSNGKQLYGRVYTDDEVTVCQGHNKASLLKFTCAFNHGEGKDTRPVDGPRFEIEMMAHE